MSNLTGINSLSVQYVDTSLNDPTSWLWDFGNGQTSSQQSPAPVTYTTGTYTVSLTVTNSLGTNTKTLVDYVSVVPPPYCEPFSTPIYPWSTFPTGFTTYAIATDVSGVALGSTATFSVHTTNIESATLYWTAKAPTGSTVSSADFFDQQLSGPVTIIANSGTIPRVIDMLATPNDKFILELRTGSISGPIVAVSTIVKIKAGLNGSACGIFPVFTPSVSDNWTMSNLGPSAPAGTKYVIENGFIQYTVNGDWTGALGDSNNTYGIGLKYDPSGTANYGVDDYIQPGNPWEGFGAIINDSYTIGGTNSHFNSYVGTLYSYNADIWQISPNHVVIKQGDPSVGIILCQYMTLEGEAIIRMKMTFTNTTNAPTSVKMIRGTDPDVDLLQYGTYNTTNQVGLDPITGTDVSMAIGDYSKKPLAIYAPGNGFTHRTGVSAAWPIYIPNSILAGVDDGYGDYAIVAAWDCGTVQPGETISVCCYYVCASTASEILDEITI